MKEGWKKVKIGDIAFIEMGQSPKSEYYNSSREGLPFLQGNRTFGERFPYFDTYCTFNKKIAEKGSILMSVRAPVGDLNIAPEKISIGRGLCSLNAKNKNNHFLFYLLKYFRKSFLNKETGTIFGSINKNDILNLEVNYPICEKIQTKISNILLSLDEKIELNRKINQNLEEIAQTLFKRWFIDFEFLNEEGNPYKSSEGKMIKSELGEIPEGWRVAKLGDFIKFIKGKKPKILVEKEDGINKFKYLTIKSINNEEENYCSDEKVIFVSKNEIMMVMDDASSGDIYIGKEGVLGSTLSKIEIDKSIDWSIIYYLLNYYKNEIKQHNTGSAIPHTDKNYIENITFFLPNNKKINYFSKIFKSILLKKIALEDEIYKLIELRDYLLPRLMSGEIDISNLKISEILNSD